ncbi:hypothetical protein TNCV_2506181 [Trichonephila clavipes]|uniref:Uncharacterized protein n=1 Tax=Trichonephila clavipes TaxID=2585209 RepID=A0A8X6WGD9_TRICX|nr:hypothetical protein TNCV_2506181 [Trichonephila clavipes]
MAIYLSPSSRTSKGVQPVAKRRILAPLQSQVLRPKPNLTWCQADFGPPTVLGPPAMWGLRGVARPSRRQRLGVERDRGMDQHGGAIGHGRMSGKVGDDLNKMVLTT